MAGNQGKPGRYSLKYDLFGKDIGQRRHNGINKDRYLLQQYLSLLSLKVSENSVPLKSLHS
jgi:hypothetical protein